MVGAGSMVIMNITENQADYCREVAAKLKAAGFRVELDLRNEKIGYKIVITANTASLIKSLSAIKRSKKTKWPCAAKQKTWVLWIWMISSHNCSKKLSDALVNH